jgi:hypothetical protein
MRPPAASRGRRLAVDCATPADSGEDGVPGKLATALSRSQRLEGVMFEGECGAGRAIIWDTGLGPTRRCALVRRRRTIDEIIRSRGEGSPPGGRPGWSPITSR